MLNYRLSNIHTPPHNSRLPQPPGSITGSSTSIAPKQEKGVVCRARLSSMHAHGEMSLFNLATQARHTGIHASRISALSRECQVGQGLY